MTSKTPEFSQYPAPSLEEILSAHADICEHNDTHTGLAAVFRSLAGSILKGAQEASGSNDESSEQAGFMPFDDPEVLSKRIQQGTQESVLEGDMHADIQEILHSETFMRAGITLAPIGEYVTSESGAARTSKELVPLVTNSALYTEFLQTLSQDDVRSEQARAFLCDIVANLSKVVDTAYDRNVRTTVPEELYMQAREVGEDVMRTFVEINYEHERLGVGSEGLRQLYEESLSNSSDDFTANRQRRNHLKAYEGMQKRIDYWGRGLLTEYIVAEKEQYLTPPDEQRFGPSQWQMDGGQYRWKQALDFVDELEQQDYTKLFADEVRESLLTSVDVALAGLEDPDEDIYWKSHEDDLVNLRRVLSGQEYDAQQLAAYITRYESY